MSVQSGGQRLRLSMLNEQLTCKLCGGYYIDATTIIECLHSFCKSCIVKYLENNKFCPICDVQVHKNKPLSNIRSDQMLQDIVYKLVPGCYQNEMRFRKEFYAKHPEAKNNVLLPEARGEPIESYIYSPDESLSLSLEYYSPKAMDKVKDNMETISKHLPRRYLRCPAAVTVFHLQKLIRAKYGLSEAHRVDIMYKEEPLCTSYSLMDIMYIYHWRRKVPLHISYRIFESSSKRLKLSEDNDEFKQSLSNSNMELASNDNEQSIKREWKEVQLKISETGVMSVMDISNLGTKKSTKISEIDEQSSLDRATLNNYSVNKAIVKIGDKESLNSSSVMLSKNKKMQDKLIKNIEQKSEEKLNTLSLSTISNSQNNFKSEEMELKSIDQHDFSNEFLKTINEKCEINCTKLITGSYQTSSIEEKDQLQNIQHLKQKIKTEILSTTNKCIDTKKNIIINHFNYSETKLDPITKRIIKLNDAKIIPSAGSKINALSAKLQFQPKVGQVNNTYSKKAILAEKKTIPSITKVTDTKLSKTNSKSEPKVTSNVSSKSLTIQSVQPKITIGPISCPVSKSAISLSQSKLINTSKTVLLPSSNNTDLSTNLTNQHQQEQPLIASTSESLTSIGLHVSTTMSNQARSSGWITDRNASVNNTKIPSVKGASPDQQLRSLPGMPQIGKDIVCSTTSGNPACSVGRFSIQTPSMSIYSITTSTKNNLCMSTTHNYSSPIKQSATKSNLEVTSMYPVSLCPDAIPISLMKSVNPRKDPISKGTALNEICAKIGSASASATAGSKINDICAKIGESSKEKSKIESQRNKLEIPDLLKISKKNLIPVSEASIPVKHIPNIPNISNVPIYTPSNSQLMQPGTESKDIIKKLSSSVAPSQAVIMSTQMQKTSTQKKHSQAIGYKTLRDPPKSWNPTLSKNNYVAVKNQAKEIQNQSQAAYGLIDGGSASKQISSKPAKIFKIRNMPRYLGNPASGVKPMYGITNEQLKEKEQTSIGPKTGPTMSMMKIDPQTLSPIVSSTNSSIIPPPSYSPTARNYQGSPFGRDICRNSSNSPISPRNSPVNMLSTNPFIPSHTPNTNPRLIYSHFPPAFSESNRFSNPLIRSPIGIPPPSAFHSSLPPSINNLYQRSGYMTQPQTNIAGFSSISTGQPPTVQRIPPSSLTLLKTSTTTPSVSVKLARSEQLQTQTPTTSTAISSIVDNVALQLAKGITKCEVGLFDFTRSESFKSSSESGKQMSPHESNSKTNENNVKLKLSPTIESQILNAELNFKQNDIDVEVKVMTVSETTKQFDRKEKSLSKLNGGIATSVASGEKLIQPKSELQRQNKDTIDCIKTSLSSALPSKPVSCKYEIAQKMNDEVLAKQTSTAQQKLKNETVDSTNLCLQSKNLVIDALKSKAES